jgi:hypothetical protein
MEYPILGGGEREGRGERKEESYPLVESKIDSKIFGASPLYLKSLGCRCLLDLTCLKSPQQTSLCNKQQGPPTSYCSQGPVSCSFAWGFLNGILILNTNPTIKTSELLYTAWRLMPKTACEMKR